MADIRINALATTAASTASDDFVAVDGSANGTRKLNAFSPTFGGNLTVSGTGDSSFAIDNAHFLALDSGNLRIRSNGYLSSQSNVGTILASNAYYSTNWTGTGTGTFLYLGVSGGAEQSKIYLGGTSSGTPTVKFTLDTSTGAATLAGNLTVSGTAINLSTNDSTDKVVSIGYSTVPLYLTSSYDGSTFGLSGFSANSRPSGSSYTTPSNTSYGNLYFLAKIAASDTASAFEWKHAPRTAGTPVTTSLMTLNGSGNLLIGTTVDSSALLQVGTNTTTAAGGMKFGTDTSLYRWQAGGLALDHIGASNPYFSFRANGTENGSLQASGGDFYITAMANKTMYLRTNGGTTALTLDSSQNATFAGAITSSRPYQDISSGLSNIYVYSTDTAAQDKGGTIQLGGAYTGTTTTTFGGVRGSKESTTAGETGGQLEFFTRANGGAMTRKAYISSTGNATFTGSIAIGNTVQTAVGVASTHKVTISIGGSTYYLLATNV